MRLSHFLVNSTLVVGVILAGRRILSNNTNSINTAKKTAMEDDKLPNEDTRARDEEAYIRELAYQIWESEGWPEGAAERHWEMAVKLART